MVTKLARRDQGAVTELELRQLRALQLSRPDRPAESRDLAESGVVDSSLCRDLELLRAVHRAESLERRAQIERWAPTVITLAAVLLMLYFARNGSETGSDNSTQRPIAAANRESSSGVEILPTGGDHISQEFDESVTRRHSNVLGRSGARPPIAGTPHDDRPRSAATNFAQPAAQQSAASTPSATEGQPEGGTTDDSDAGSQRIDIVTPVAVATSVERDRRLPAPVINVTPGIAAASGYAPPYYAPSIVVPQPVSEPGFFVTSNRPEPRFSPNRPERPAERPPVRIGDRFGRR